MIRPQLAFLCLLIAAPARVEAITSRALRKLLADPPREYATAPLWVWNDRLTDDEVRGTMRDLAGQDVRQVFVHPRPGLMTPYLSTEWFRLWKVALDEAKRLDMNVWIYDENSYPSGFAGGWVPEEMPEARGLGLSLREARAAPKWTPDLLAVFGVGQGGAEDVSRRVKAGEAFPEGRYVVAALVTAPDAAWTGNRPYVNLLTRGVTEKFLDLTLGAYEREVGEQFGKRVPGVFTDEPNIRPAGGLPWCEDLPQEFEKRWGYPLRENLPSLALEVGDWRRVRHNFYSTLNDLFIERWARPYYDWCDRRGLEFTGHYWDHEWPHCVGVPDNMAMAAWQHRPGIDTLMNQYAENTHAQFGNVRFCREISSLANQLGRRRTLVELYGAGGWDLRFEDMKRIGDWLQVLGINTMDEHLSYITLRGARKRDHPQSFSYHEPWWEAYHLHARYLARLSCALSQGQQLNRVLVLEPTTTAWMYQGNEAKLRELGDSFFDLLRALEAAQVEYDLGCEDVMAREARVEGRGLRVGRRLYERVILPPGTENLRASTWALLQGFLSVSQTNLFACQAPIRKDGALVEAGNESAAWDWQLLLYRPDEALGCVGGTPGDEPFRIVRPPNDPGILFHHRRRIDDGQILFLVNTSISSPSAGTIESDLKGVELWDPYTGRAEPYPFERAGAGVKAGFQLPPSGSLLLFLSEKPLRPPRSVRNTSDLTMTLPGATRVTRLDPNVLTLDYVDITAGGETRSNQYFYAANRFAWQKHGLDRNPWDNAVQFKDELITRTFPADSGFTATYRFALEGTAPRDLEMVVERPDLYTITCNGRPVQPTPGSWWLDRAFGRIPLGSTARPGENTVTLAARPLTTLHELEPAYLRGDFTLRPHHSGFVVAPAEPLRLLGGERKEVHGLNPDGTMWLSGGIDGASGVADRRPFVEFELGRSAALGAIRIWNYNEAHVRDLTARGANAIRVSGAPESEPEDFRLDLGTFRLGRANGRAALPELLTFDAAPLRYVRIDILSNHYGVEYPAAGEPQDSGFVGLAEVQFLDPEGRRLNAARVRRASTELASHQRLARHLVDGSGLSESAGVGWDEQGHPFYGAGVAYGQVFDAGKLSGRYFLGLRQWRGSVAEVKVNGRRAGYISAPPWDCEITKALRRGTNMLEVVVIGTLKNTLGPHHGNPPLGTAWPGMFQHGPNPGPPPGKQYSTVGYGLFEPFVIRHHR